MSYYGMVACVLTLAEELQSVIWSEEPVKDHLHLPNKRFSSTSIFNHMFFRDGLGYTYMWYTMGMLVLLDDSSKICEHVFVLKD